VDDESFAVTDLSDVLVKRNANTGGAAFRFQHGDNVARGAIAEELAERFFVISDSISLDQRDEITGRVAGERRSGEMWVGGEEAVGCAVEVGEVAAAAAGDEDLFADAIGMIENNDAPAALAGSDGSHEPGRSRAEHEDIASLVVMSGWNQARGHVGTV
jgi:hypothetical protein